jgi:hypothetical protein
MRIIRYRAERSASDYYQGIIDIESDEGRFGVCFSAMNFCLHDGEFFNPNSIPMNRKDYKEACFSISSNGTFMTRDRIRQIEKALEQAIICS